AFSWRPGEAWYLPLRAPEGEAHLDQATVLAALAPIFSDPSIAKVNQNIKYDMLVLEGQGVSVHGVAGDSMIADYLLSPGGLNHNLDDLALRYLAHRTIPITDLIGKRGKSQKCMDEVPVAQIAEYAGEDAEVSWRLTELLDDRLQKERLHDLY